VQSGATRVDIDVPQVLEPLLFNARYANWAGPVAMAAGMGLSIWLFSNQTEYVGLVPQHIGSVGDLTLEAGFTVTAIIYLLWRGAYGRTAIP
jgi:NCS1 family nucleobase:cation symporter-1